MFLILPSPALTSLNHVTSVRYWKHGPMVNMGIKLSQWDCVPVVHCLKVQNTHFMDGLPFLDHSLITLPDSDTNSDSGCNPNSYIVLDLCRTFHITFRFQFLLPVTRMGLELGSESESGSMNLNKPLHIKQASDPSQLPFSLCNISVGLFAENSRNWE